MTVEISKKAAKVIGRMDEKTKQRLKAAIHALPEGDTRLLSGSVQAWRLRVGGWRILFSYPDEGTILVEKVAPRGQAYKE